MPEKKDGTARSLTVGLAVVVALLALRPVSDTDTWTHLCLGRMIWEGGGLPHKEAHVFAAVQRPFFYTSWLHGVLLYGAHALAGYGGLVALRIGVLVLAFVLLARFAKGNAREPYLGVLLVTAAAVLMRGRFVDRPDVVLFCLLAFSLWSLDAYLREGRRWAYALPAVHLLWANLHSSVLLAFVVYAALLGGAVLQRWLGTKGQHFCDTPPLHRLRTGFLLLAASSVAVLINPNGYHQLFYGSSLIGQRIYREQIGELLETTWQRATLPYILVALLALLATAAILHAWRARASQPETAWPALAPLLLTVPFAYAALDTLRFVYLLVFVGAAVAARLASYLAEATAVRLPRHLLAATAAVGLAVAVPVALASAPSRWTGPKELGAGADLSQVPAGASAYLDDRGIAGRVYTSFEFGGYIAWKGYPGRTVFVDSRGAIAEDLLEKMQVATTSPEVFEQLRKRFGFEVAVLPYPRGASELPDTNRDLALASPGWQLVHWDDTALVYLYTAGQHHELAARDAYLHVRPANGLAHIEVLARGDNELQEAVKAELIRNVQQTGSLRGSALLGEFLSIVGDLEAARAFLAPAIRSCEPRCPELLSSAYLSFLGRARETGASAYLKSMEPALQSPRAALRAAQAELNAGDPAAARELLETLRTKTPGDATVDQLLIRAYRQLGLDDKASEIERQSAKTAVADSARRLFEAGVAAYTAGRRKEAITAFTQSLAQNPNNPAAHTNLGFLFYDLGNLDAAASHHTQALKQDPNSANAYYGLALIYSDTKQTQLARKSWEAYLRLEPEGYFARRARAELERLAHE